MNTVDLPADLHTHPAADLAAVRRHARQTAGYDERVAAALTRLRQVAAAYSPRIVQASSLGAEDMVITDMIARHGLPITVATLDTGALHEETLALLPRIESRYGLAVERWAPAAEAVVTFVRRHGERSMYESIEQRKACCALRKLEPLGRLLAGRGAWVTGLRREESATRAEVPFEQIDEQGRVKLNPLADWSEADVWHYIGNHRVPYNPLHDRFFPSIGCAPCTRAVSMGEDPRAGRWWWEQEGAKECGLHVAQPLPAARSPRHAEPEKADA
jgi:phosphoadenosine phosphosulfate reductase